LSSATAQSKALAVVNGVNVRVIDAVKADVEIAKFNFRLMNKWLGGVKTRPTIKEFSGALQTHRSKATGFTVDSASRQFCWARIQRRSPASGCCTRWLAA
jgi:hypothetical protein